MKKLIELNNITKILLIVLVVAISYFIIFLLIRPFFISQPTNMMDMMNQMTSRGIRTEDLFSLVIALIIGVIASFYLFKIEQKEKTKVKDYEIIKKILSEDEKKILDEIKRAKEITQDSLRFRLGWSKAKISTILTNLDRKGLVQRERIGKTYKIYLQKV